MDFRNARARQPEILRSVQKDSSYVNELSSELSDLLRLTGPRNWIKYNHMCKSLAAMTYHGFASLNNLQTLGEEYTGVIQVDANYKHIPSRMLQFTAILLEFCGEALYLKILRKLEEYVAGHKNMLPEAKRQLTIIIQAMRNLPFYIKALHKSVFYLRCDKYQLSKRMTGINYVLIRHWLQQEISLYGYKLLGVITFIQVSVSLIISSMDMWRDKLSQKAVGGELKRNIEKQSGPEWNTSRNTQCALCLEPRQHTALTQCGHLFCWNCVLEWLDERDECPLCRETVKKSNVIQLQNY